MGPKSKKEELPVSWDKLPTKPLETPDEQKTLIMGKCSEPDKDAETTVNLAHNQGVPELSQQQSPILRPIDNPDKPDKPETPLEISKLKDEPIHVPKPFTKAKLKQNKANPENQEIEGQVGNIEDKDVQHTDEG